MTKTWTYGVCEVCLNNSHERVVMIRENIVTGDPVGRNCKELWVCPVCGYTRKY